MSRYRKGAGGKRDENEPAIIKALRAHGCVVWQLSGKGIPDLIVLRKRKKWLADVKMPGKPTTEAQEELWEEAATKAQCAVFILRTPEDAVKMLNNELAPWQPATPRIGNDGRLVLADLKGNARMVEVARRMRANEPVYGNTPRKGDAAKARKRPALKVYQHCSVDGCERGERCGKVATSTGMGHAIRPLEANYTPPRSKPVAHRSDCEQVYHKDDREPCTCGALDAAKEAEVFAPTEKAGTTACCGLYETVGEHDATCDHFVSA